MKSIFHMVLMLILTFGTLSAGTEVYKAYRVLSVFQDEVGNIAMDALELGIVDEYRMEHILIVDPQIAQLSFYTLLSEHYHLTEDLKPLFRRDIISQIHLQVLSIEKGIYTEGGQQLQQTVYPTLRVKGTLEIKVTALLIDKTIQVPFFVQAICKRSP